MPGIFTVRGGSVPRCARRLTCTTTMPPLRRVACAIDSISPGIASCSIVTLPSSSAVVPRRKATSKRNGLKRSHSSPSMRDQLDQVLARAGALARAALARIDEGVQARSW